MWLEAFLDYDNDKSGSIDHVEFRRLLERYNIFMNEYEFQKFMSRVDPDGSGEVISLWERACVPYMWLAHRDVVGCLKVDYHEFLAYFSKLIQGKHDGRGGTNDIGLENPRVSAF